MQFALLQNHCASFVYIFGNFFLAHLGRIPCEVNSPRITVRVFSISSAIFFWSTRLFSLERKTLFQDFLNLIQVRFQIKSEHP